MEEILSLLKNNIAYKSLIDGKDIVVNSNSAEALVVTCAFFQLHKDILIVKPTLHEANNLYDEIAKMTDDVTIFSSDESFRVEALTSSPELLIKRLKALHTIGMDKPKILICHIHSVIRYVPTKELFNNSIIHLKQGDTVDLLSVQDKLVQIGYHNISRVEQPLYFSKRGGVIDIYSPQYDYPIRIEFFDDEIDYIKFYNPSSQRTIDKIESIDILPATEILYQQEDVNSVLTKMKDLLDLNSKKLDSDIYDELDEKVAMDMENLRQHDNDSHMYGYYGLFDNTDSIISYLNDPLVLISKKKDCDFSYKNFISENYFYNEELFSLGKYLKGLELFFDYQKIIPSDYQEIKEFGNEKDVAFNTRDIIMDNPTEKQVIDEIDAYLKTANLLISLADSHQVQLICKMLDDHEYKYHSNAIDNEIQKGINIGIGKLSSGLELLDEHLVILTAKELFGHVHVKKAKYFKYKDARVIKDYQELNVGDYVVHDAYGIGQYLGIKTLEVHGFHKDYLHVSYAGNDTLYIPVEQFKLIRKYSSVEGKVPKIHSLGSKQWLKLKQKARNKIDDIADQLIEIYSKRMACEGFCFSPDNELQLEFENKFPYELTDDQQRSIDEIKNDMENQHPMDRLLCGDVGFGKTEVALRAAFKAITDNKQVAFLCPTTILSMQHYHTIEERFKDFGVEIGLLNRFTTTKEKNRIIKGLKAGSIDFVIGTHRVLSKDVEFKDLGFLIIDEEQRFGVKQKEKIKEYRETIDVLALSATPIPRTLQMSLMGIRGLSQIDTPPKNRLPVQTYVIEKNNTLVSQVIQRELARDGQVFYLHNRTSSLNNVAYTIASKVPDAKVAVAHGQMDKHELEDVMQRFLDKEFNVLVCTTIVETGIDIANANTMIVDEADHFGLSQLYQIRGRVGRSNRVAYAYFLYNGKRVMNEEAAKRLKAIKEFTELGSGYKIAMRDLAIRGSGDIFGGKQAGFMDAIGYETYMSILQEALNSRNGSSLKEEQEEVKSININVDGYIPENYVESDFEKLELYQSIEKANNLKELSKLKYEFEDFYGHLPEQVLTLIDKRQLDILANNKDIEEILDVGNTVKITFTKESSNALKGDELFVEANKLFTKPSFAYIEEKISLTLNKSDKWLKNLNRLLTNIDKATS